MKINMTKKRNLPTGTCSKLGMAPISGVRQQGVALVITLVVMLVLTIVAIASTNSNQTQAIMVKNNQFRLEAFNTSYAEINAQVMALNERATSSGVPDYMATLLNGATQDTKVYSGAENDGDAASELDILVETDDSNIEREIIEWYKGTCFLYGDAIGAGSEVKGCFEIIVESKAAMVNTQVSSRQFQIVEYIALKETN